MASTEKSLVLGFAARLDPTFIEPFARSLRATGYIGRLGLVLAQYDERDLSVLSALADLVMVVDDRYGTPNRELLWLLKKARSTRGFRRYYTPLFMLACRIGRERTSQARWEALEFHIEGLQALRYGIYYDFIRELAPDADKVMISDLRDVFFQGDPFERRLDGLEVVLEDPSHRFANDPFNGRWVRNLAGPVRFAEMALGVPSCSGTVLGTQEAMMHYLREMSACVTWRRRPLGSHDQGVHNLLVHSGRMSSVTIERNGVGRVLTMGGMTGYDVDDDGRILNQDGSLPAVVHQFDRHPELALHIRTRLAAPTVDGEV